MLKQAFYILFIYFTGEFISSFIDGFIPGSVIGMILLFLALVFKLVKIAPIRRGIVTMRGYAFVGKTLVCEVGEFMAQVAKTKK